MRRALTFALLGLLFALPARAEHFPFEKGWKSALHDLQRQLDAIPPGKQVVYLSGPVSTGGKGSIEANLAEGMRVGAELRARGYVVLSPFEAEATIRGNSGAGWKQHATFMRVWSKVLEHPRIDAMVVLPGGESSVGTTQEIGLFVKQGR